MYKYAIRYSLAGAFATIFSMFSFPLIYEELFLKNYFNLAFVISCILNVALSFFLQRVFVFRSKNKILKELTKFLMGAAFLILVGYAVTYIFVQYMGLSSYRVNIAVVAMSSVASFVWHKFLTFGDKS